MNTFAFAVAVFLASAVLASSVTAQTSAGPSIEGRWLVSTGEYLPGSIPPDLVISVDRGRIYGMIGDFQIRGTVSEGTFSFDADWPQHPLAVNGALHPDGTLGGRLSLTSSPAADGTRLKKTARVDGYAQRSKVAELRAHLPATSPSAVSDLTGAKSQ